MGSAHRDRGFAEEGWGEGERKGGSEEPPPWGLPRNGKHTLAKREAEPFQDRLRPANAAKQAHEVAGVAPRGATQEGPQRRTT